MSENVESVSYLISQIANKVNAHTNNVSNPHNVSAADVGLGNVADIDQSEAIKSITRDGTTYTVTRLDGTTDNFDQADTATIKSISVNGTAITPDKTKNVNITIPEKASSATTADSAAKLTTPINIAVSGAVTGSAESVDGSKDITINTTGVDASKINSGTISIDRLPQGALERLVHVTDDSARFALTTDNVQLGDTVQVDSTGLMYIVVDESKLNSADGYSEYTAGKATSVPWSGVTGAPTSLPANGGIAENISGIIAIAHGGTGATNAVDARTNLGLGALATKDSLSASDVGALPSGTTYAGSSTASGVATSASKLAVERTISLTGDVTGSTSFDGSVNASITATTADFTGATSSAAGKHGAVPAPAKGDQNKFLRGDKTWQTVDKSTIGLNNVDNKSSATIRSEITSTNVTNALGYTPINSAFTGATKTTAGTSGLVPAPKVADDDKYLSGNGTWKSITDAVVGTKVTSAEEADSADKLSTAQIIQTDLGSTVAASFDGTEGITPGVTGTLPIANGGTGSTTASGARSNLGIGDVGTKSTNSSTTQFLRGDGTWATPTYPSVSNSTITIKQTGRTDQTFTLNGGATTINLNDNNTWDALKGASTTTDGIAGYAPAPTKGDANRYLRSDGTWAVPPDNNTWNALKGATATASGSAGYAPAPASGDNNKYLCGDGTWKSIDETITNTKVINASNADNANKVTNSLTIQFNGTTNSIYDGSEAKTVNIAKSTLGLDKVDNTADAEKSVNHANTSDKLSSVANITLSGAVSSEAVGFDGSSDIAIPVNTVDATKLTGTVPLENLPKAALERVVTVADDDARYALTSDNVQLGDTVKVTSTDLMYLVVDESKLNSEDGYITYTAQQAASVPWSGVTNAPDFATKEYVDTNKSTSTTITLQASNWTGSAVPYTYDIGSQYTNKTVVVGFNGQDGTKEQLTASMDANIQGGAGSKLYAFGNKPTIDIPVLIISF